MEHFDVDFPFKELIDGRMFPESFGTLYRSASFLEFQHFHTPNSEWTDLTQQLEIFQSLLLLWQVSDWSEAFENPMIFTYFQRTHTETPFSMVCCPILPSGNLSHSY